jgi:16S rRNA (uracil1498-N3)-methyltransferase
MPVFFITADQMTGTTVTVTGPLLDHLRASLRIQTGERIWVGDGRRRRYLIEVAHIDKRTLRGNVVEQRTDPARTAPRLLIGQAILKGERMDWAIQKATELGIAEVIPLVTEQTIVRPKQGRTGSQQERWQRIALEAAQQSERWEIPSIGTPSDAAEFFAAHHQAAGKFILSEREAGQGLGSVALPASPADTIVLAVGPEGGWRDEELAQARTHGFIAVTLGARILRAETAALAAASVLQSRLGELG